VAAKKGNPKFKLLLGAINQYPYTDYYAAWLSYYRHNFADGVTGSKDVIDDEDSFATANAETSLKSPFRGTFLFSKYATHS
jgi:hypothetical protein